MSELQFDAATHTYRLGDRVLPSVTQITSTIAPLVGIAPSVLEAKAALGTAVHLATEMYDKGHPVKDVADDVRPYLEAYGLFRAETGFKPTHIEHRVVYEAYGYAGTLDRIGKFPSMRGVRPEQLCVLDLKATYRIAPIYGVQTALYAAAFDRMFLMPRFALQLRPDSTYRLKQFHDRSDLSVGLAALTLMNWRARYAERN